MAPRRGRKATKNETASALLNALGFISMLKSPPNGSPEQYDYVFLNQGNAVGYNGIIAAGHPIPGDIVGYPHTKLFAEALDNTDKTFTLTRRDDGAFEVGSDKYTAIVPVMDPSKVIATFPDRKQAQFNDPAMFLEAIKIAMSVTVETGTTAAYSAVRFNENTFIATNGTVMLEVRHGNSLPPVTVPRQFLAAIAKADKELDGVGLNGDWTTLTVWFKDGSWLRTNLYDKDLFSEDMLAIFYQNAEYADGIVHDEIPVKLWATVRAVLPWAEENKVRLRTGIVQTHADTHTGAALKLDKLNIDVDINGALFLGLEDFATYFAVLDNAEPPMLTFRGGADKIPPVRGIMAAELPSADDSPAQGGWGASAEQDSAPDSAGDASGGWGMAGNIAPPADDPPPRREAGPQQEWKGGPAEGLANDPEFLSQYHGEPEENFRVEPETAFVFSDQDNGIDLTGMNWNEAIQEGFKPSGWLNNLTDDDAGIKG